MVMADVIPVMDSPPRRTHVTSVPLRVILTSHYNNDATDSVKSDGDDNTDTQQQPPPTVTVPSHPVLRHTDISGEKATELHTEYKLGLR